AVLLGINIANFDYLIAHHSKARTQSGTDYVYLTNLSPDALYYKETLSSLVGQIEGSTAQEHEKIIAAYRVLEKIEWLKRKYGDNTPVNSFNFSEHQEYRNLRDISTQEYRKRLSDVQQRYNSQEKRDSNYSPSE